MKAFDKSLKRAKRVSITIVSSNVNEVLRAIFKFLYSKISRAQKVQNVYKQTKRKNGPKKDLREK